MVEIEAWYDIDDERPIILRSLGDLDALLARMMADGMGQPVPPLVELACGDVENYDDDWAISYVGLNPRKGLGLITHTDPSGSVVSSNGTGAKTVVEYDYMGHLRELPASVEIPVDEVRRAVREFVTTGGARPVGVTWQSPE